MNTDIQSYIYIVRMRPQFQEDVVEFYNTMDEVENAIKKETQRISELDDCVEFEIWASASPIKLIKQGFCESTPTIYYDGEEEE